MSSSNPYQSRLFKFVVQQTRQLRDRSVQTWRQLRLGILWGTQITVYPIYAAFQATRLTGRQLQQTVRRSMPQLQATRRTIQTRIQAIQTGVRARVKAEKQMGSHEQTMPSTMAVDAPVTKTLEAVQALFLNPDFSFLPYQTDLASRAQPSLSESSELESSELSLQSQPHFLTKENLEKAELVAQPQPFLTQRDLSRGELSQSQPTLLGGGLVTATLPTPASLQTPVSLQATATQLEAVQGDPVRGIATLLSTRKLVLTTVQNCILDITPEQEKYLRRRLIAEMADCLRQWRQFAPRSPSPLLSPPARRPNALPPVRSFYDLMRWMQSSSVAIAVNLFNEAGWAAYAVENAAKQAAEQSRLDFEKNPWDEDASERIGLEQTGVPLSFKERSKAVSRLDPGALPPQKSVPLLPSSRRLVLAASQAIAAIKPRNFSKTIKTRATLVQSSSSNRVIVPEAPPSSLDSQPLSPSLAPVSLAEMQIQPADLTLDLTRGDRPLPPARQDAIDTQATLVKYVKHPLQQVLEWIDLGMVWIERRVVQFVTWLRRNL